MIPNFIGGLHAAMDVSCINSLQAQTVVRAAEEPGYALGLRHQQKWSRYGEACLAEGIRFCPLIVEAHGGWHQEAVDLLKRLAQALAQATGGDEKEATCHFFGRLSILLQGDNATLLLNRVPELVDPSVDGNL